MLIGIDVGGTFTDGVSYENGAIKHWVKQPTDAAKIKETVLSVLDELLTGMNRQSLTRVVISTTVVTNLAATGGMDRYALMIIPGPGIHPDSLNLAEKTFVLQGGIDFRGREITPINPEQIRETVKKIADLGIERIGVVGKFSHRNPAQELEAASIIQKTNPKLTVLCGHQAAGRMNFPRRAVTTGYTLATERAWNRFVNEIEAALTERGITAEAEVMKADGGTMSFAASKTAPCQTVFSGPAASTLGAYALTMDQKTSVVVDIGGTTSDLAMILAGKPLQASKGAAIEGRLTQISALAVRSIPLGGDSAVRLEQGMLGIGPDRLGPAACFGGDAPTPTDAFNLISRTPVGDAERSYQALAAISGGKDVRKLAEEIVDRFEEMLELNIKEMLTEWEQEPAYKVWEIVHRRKAHIDRVIGIGAAAPAFVPILAERMGLESFVHPLSGVGNALGAALARPTLSVMLHADTLTSMVSVDGETKPLPEGRLQMSDIKRLAEQELLTRARQRGMEQYWDDRAFFLEEQFNSMRGWATTTKLFDVGIAIEPGVIHEFKGVKP